MQSKQEKEAAFHDAAFTNGVRQNVSKFYLIMDSCHGFYRDHLRAKCPGGNVLELGCGQDSNAIFMARNGAREVTGIDISSVAIEQAHERARQHQVTHVSFEVMDAEAVTFPDDSFDLICGVAILHHLDLRKTLAGLARTLKPGGAAIFLEPLAHNPAINLYRRMTPHLRTEDEHPLTMDDLKLMKEYFGDVSTQYFHLTSLAAAPFHRFPGFERIVEFFDSSDKFLFERLRFLRKYAWTVGLVFTAPRKQAVSPAPAQRPASATLR